MRVAAIPTACSIPYKGFSLTRAASLSTCLSESEYPVVVRQEKMSQWNPQRTLAETDELLCAPGALHELETCLVDGRLQRVYKNLWPSLREFWLWASQQHPGATYVVFEQQRCTFRDVFRRSVRAASMYRAVYGIQKGWPPVSVSPSHWVFISLIS